ncbi:CsbD-like [Rhodopseudomonas palustris HaA2]|uniref:CsbD-like n=1 Tax=Rhodopseudomonas palustris (strain HaA2) TaxID=316058 RepID=Q2IS94_RHOP2|nr:CsbD family protein [Rhodopseudomonas palustris]ABD08916.1 CsbD-like [Rhodopseudomonas palustris HaA2]
MGSTMDKIKGTANEMTGKAKQGIGEATGSEKLQGEGAVQEIKGKGQKAMGDAKEAVKDTTDKVSDAAHRNL